MNARILFLMIILCFYNSLQATNVVQASAEKSNLQNVAAYIKRHPSYCLCAAVLCTYSAWATYCWYDSWQQLQESQELAALLEKRVQELEEFIRTKFAKYNGVFDKILNKKTGT